MPETAGNEDAWVAARLSALERANRRLWATLGALGMTLIALSLAVVFAAANLSLPGARGGADSAGSTLVADDITVRGALRVVDEAGRNLIFVGRERAAPGSASSSGQALIGLFADSAEAERQQTIRIATSPLGSALSLSTPDGSSSSSVFAGESGALLELRRGETARVISERDESAASGSRKSAQTSERRTESPAVAAPRPRGAERGASVDLNDPAFQPIGDGLYLGRLSLSDRSGSLRVQGTFVNASSVNLVRSEFRLTVAGRELPFSVAGIPAGGSAGFAIEIPAASPAALRSAQIRWVRSMLGYLSD